MTARWLNGPNTSDKGRVPRMPLQHAHWLQKQMEYTTAPEKSRVFRRTRRSHAAPLFGAESSCRERREYVINVRAFLLFTLGATFTSDTRCHKRPSIPVVHTVGNVHVGTHLSRRFGDMAPCPICCESACAECIVCPACGAGCCRSCFERSLELNNDCCCFCKKRGMRAVLRRLSKVGDAGTCTRLSVPSVAPAFEQATEKVNHQFAAPGEVGQEFSAMKAGADREARVLQLEYEVASLESTLAQGGGGAGLLSGFEVAQAGARAAAIRDLLARAAAGTAVDVSEGALLGVTARLLLENRPPSAPSFTSSSSLGAAVGVQPRQAAAATLLQSWCKPKGPSRPAAAGAARRRSSCGDLGAAAATAASSLVSHAAAVSGREGGHASPPLRLDDTGAALAADLGCDEVIVVDVEGELEAGEWPQKGRASSCTSVGHTNGGKVGCSRGRPVTARLPHSVQLGISFWVQQQDALRSVSAASRCSGRSRDNRLSSASSRGLAGSGSSSNAGSALHHGQQPCPDDGLVEVLGEEDGGEDGSEAGACGGAVEVRGVGDGGGVGAGGRPLAAATPWTVGASTHEGHTASPVSPAAGGTAPPFRQFAHRAVSDSGADATLRGNESSCLPGPAPGCASASSTAVCSSASSLVNASSESTACLGGQRTEASRLQPEGGRPGERAGGPEERRAGLNAPIPGAAGCGGQCTVSGVKRSHYDAFSVSRPVP